LSPGILGKDEGVIGKVVEVAISTEFEYEKRLWDEYFELIKSRKDKILLVSHEYILNDDLLNMGIADMLKELEAEPILIDTVPFKYEERFSEPLFWMRWDFGMLSWIL